MEAHTSGASPLGCDQQRFGGDPEAVADARAFACAAMARWGMAERADDVQLCVSELAANAVVHGGMPISGFALRVVASAHRLRVEVCDHGAGRPVRRAAACEDTCGRGLLLVDALADAWGVDDHAIGKTVWAEFTITDRPLAAWRVDLVPISQREAGR